MDCERIAYALREIADALTDSTLSENVPRAPKSRPKILRPPPPLENREVDDVTRARAKRILRAKGYVIK